MARLLIAALVLLAASSRPAAAQDRVTVFLHGFNSNGASWYATASRLGARLRIAPTAPNLPWHLPFDQQASGLHQAASAAGAPPDTVVVGHSNGGLIARQLSTKRPLGGIVTLGSPHAGAPLARNIQAAGVHYLVTGQKLGLLLYMLGASNGTNQFSGIWFSPGLAPLRAAIATLGLALESSTAIAREALFVSTSVPVLSDMVPGSPALSALNSASNLARERAAVPRRVGLVYAARDWWIGAPFVAAQPEYQYWGNAAVGSGIAFLGYIRAYFDYPNFAPWDPVATSIRNQAASVIADLLIYNSVWCWATSDDPSCSTSTDGVVPTSSQYFPGDATNVGYYGPAHLREKDLAEDGLFDALTRHLGIRTRGEPTGNPGGSPASTLTAGERLYAGQNVWSPNGQVSLRYQSDGNLVLYGPQGPAWSSATHGTSAGYVEMQQDGNLVVYDAAGHPVWATDTSGIPGAELRVQDDGYIVLYDAGGTVVWHGPGW